MLIFKEYVISWHVCPFDYLLITYSIVIEMEGGGIYV